MGTYVQRLAKIEAVQYLPFTGEVGDAVSLADWVDQVINSEPGGNMVVDPAGTDENGFRVSWTDGDTYTFEGKPGHWILGYFPPEILSDTEFRRRWELPRV